MMVHDPKIVVQRHLVPIHCEMVVVLLHPNAAVVAVDVAAGGAAVKKPDIVVYACRTLEVAVRGMMTGSGLMYMTVAVVQRTTPHQDVPLQQLDELIASVRHGHLLAVPA